MRLGGKRALVTGAAGGLGLEIARRFAHEGAQVAMADVQIERARAEANAMGRPAVAVELDVTSSASIDAARAIVEEAFGGLDILVNNAGICIGGAAHEISENDWEKLMSVNLSGVYRVSKAFWPLLAESTAATIINVASLSALRIRPNHAAYAASKAGVVALTRCQARDGAKLGIRANSVCPGLFATEMSTGFLQAQSDPQQLIRDIPLGRIGKPTDIANAVLYLASDEASWVTGTNLVVDGGLLGCSA